MTTVLVAVALAGGCTTATTSHQTSRTAVLATVASVPFQLYTHCGIHETKFAHGYYDAVPPLDDGNGNPPPGWGNPFQSGAMTRQSTTEVLFTDKLGHRVEFRLRPGATEFRQLCS